MMRRLGGLMLISSVALLGLPGRADAGAREDRLVDAAKRRDIATMKALVAQRADVNAAGPDGATALHWAAHWDEVEGATLLLRAHANPSVKNDLGVTPLTLACANGSSRVVDLLLTAGANPNQTSTDESPLMVCARSGSAAAVS